jgi:hypothetical protein
LGEENNLNWWGLASCLAIAFANSATAQSQKLVLHYAGFARSGDAAAVANSFPYSTAIGLGSLQAELRRHIAGVTSSKFDLTESQGNTKAGDSLAVAFVVTWENLAQEEVDSNFKVTADVRAEALIFDFLAKKVIAAVPFGVERRDVLPAVPSALDVLNEFRQIYFGQQHNIFDGFVAALSSVDIKPSYGAYTQLVKIDIEDNAESLIRRSGVDLGQARAFVAGAFDASLSTNASIPVLPFVAGQAIGGAMAAQFANGDVYNLALPPPDFPISLTLRGFKKVVVDSNVLETGYAYASYFHLVVGQPLTEKPYLDTDIKYAVSKVVPQTVSQTNDWAAFQESVLSSIDEITKQLAKPDAAWLRRWADGPTAMPQFVATAQALARCR